MSNRLLLLGFIRGGESFGKGGVAMATQVMAGRDWSCWQPTLELEVKKRAVI